jgi:hypothetical protein
VVAAVRPTEDCCCRSLGRPELPMEHPKWKEVVVVEEEEGEEVDRTLLERIDATR